ncbi:ketol-acid reductoisomerase [Buchnera aphidicola (Thelaxes californica)]|uniref:Ketol-acid reductoisomerase (NADP(+)) n=1 Tax=Buchnera aphidicola (Thelaxes californica) TaxID=1315998 RepID=A0A4D6YCB1_9GAMM|nr:ketol-acid reductoisomerase [Buchnera aphidicola]QCI26979.1 ketol-acid reductoisomerase [Buchnera aphidicola (Thelaxes californica)]
MRNYFNQLNFREKNIELKKCRFMKKKEFDGTLSLLKNKNIVIIGCGAQGLNQGLNMRDSGLNVSFALRNSSIKSKNASWKNAVNNGFMVNTYKKLIPDADVVINLTPDKQHKNVIEKIENLMKIGAILGYSHGFNIVEMGQKIRKDITVIMVAPKCPGTEVRTEYLKGFGVPALIAVHKENDPNLMGLNIAKAWAVSIGSHHAGILESSFIAEVKSDLMGEQTILCGMLQAASIVYFDKLIQEKISEEYAVKFIQNGWEVLTEALKQGGITLMMDRLSNTSKIQAFQLSEKLKMMLSPIFKKHMDDILSGDFSLNMMKDWEQQDHILLSKRKATLHSNFERASFSEVHIDEEEFFQNGAIMVAILKSGIELSFEIMVESGILKESAYYESLHELPLIANTIARKKLYEMNLVISDTAEYGNYLFEERATPILNQFFDLIHLKKISLLSQKKEKNIDNIFLKNINELIRNHPIEKIGSKLRTYMIGMKKKIF